MIEKKNKKFWIYFIEKIAGCLDCCRKYPSLEVRLVSNYPLTSFVIYDKKEIFIIEFSTVNLTESPALWSNCPSLLALANEYFDASWLRAMEKML